jgi:hypothetical protein
MKVIGFIRLTAVTALTLTAGFGCATQQNTDQTNSPGATEKGPSYATGSYIPRDYNRSGPVTDGQNNLRIIDRSDIDRSGGADPKQTLRELGVTH